MTTPQPPGRKRPWYVRPLRFVSQTFSVKGYATDNTDGFVRQVVVNLTMDEPGKGGTDTPQRPVILRLNPSDATTAATAMIARAREALERNRQHQDGGGYTNHWPEDSTVPEPNTRRMTPQYASDTEALVQTALDRITRWEVSNPHIGDYRLTETRQALVRAGLLLSYIRDDTDPRGDAARARLKASGFFDHDTPEGADRDE